MDVSSGMGMVSSKAAVISWTLRPAMSWVESDATMEGVTSFSMSSWAGAWMLIELNGIVGKDATVGLGGSLVCCSTICLTMFGVDCAAAIMGSITRCSLWMNDGVARSLVA